ncbi:MAG: hypothetical protein H0U16_07070 [Actinobacteria bacterium]|nr:hypothetical protein [Actinomycetota bacterium]
MNGKGHKREIGGEDVGYGALRIEFENEVLAVPGSWDWAIDANEVRVYAHDRTIFAYPIHRVLSITCDRFADHSGEIEEADKESAEQHRAEARERKRRRRKP